MNSGSVEGEHNQVLAIGIFAPEAAVVEDDLTALNVIAIAKATQAEAALAAFSDESPVRFKIACWRLRLYGAVRRIVSAWSRPRKSWRLSIEAAREAIELGDGTDRKR
jgi:hypothetical protein